MFKPGQRDGFHRIRIACVLVLTLCFLGACTRDLMTVKFSGPMDREVVPLEKTSPFLIITGVIAGQKRSWIVDSAASRTFIDQGFAETLGLKHKSHAKGRDFNGEYAVREVTSLPIQVGSLTLKSLAFLTMNTGPISKIARHDIVGILGHDFLSDVITELDFAVNAITFHDPEKIRLTQKPGATSGYAHRRYAAFRGKVNQTIDVRWIVDTGSTRSTLLTNLLIKHPQILEHRKGSHVNQAGSSRNMLTLVQLPSLHLAGREYQKVEIEAAETSSDRQVFKNEAVDGILGLDLLRDYRVYLDFGNEMFLLVNKDSATTTLVLEPRR